jgi:serine/threonine-protein kinase
MPADVPRKIGRYEIQDRIGRGGMGVLYLARDPAIDRLVAIKVLRAEFEDEDARDRFAGEARAAGRLRHPNIVTIHDVGEDDGSPYIAMEYIPGETLDELIRRRAPLSLARKLHLIEELCKGLGYAHKAGLIHRDIKPANVMVDPEGVVKILDFGIARIVSASSSRATLLAGTPSYMSPEQAQSRPLDARSDMFAVGAVFYELLAYQRAFPGETMHAVMYDIIHKAPEPLRKLCPDLNPRIEPIVMRALEKDPDQRYPDLQVMRTEIERVRDQVLSREEQRTIVLPGPLRPVQDTPSRDSDRFGLAKRRAAQIDRHVADAERELAAARLDEALDAAEQALLLNQDEPRALALIDRIRHAINAEKLRGYLETARDRLRQGDVTGAEFGVLQALAVDAQNTEAVSLQRDVQQVRRDQARRREQQQLAERALARARESFDAGAFELAIRAATEALAHDSSLDAARDVRDRAEATLQAQREQAAAEAAAEAIARARTLFESGDEAAAVAALDSFSPARAEVREAAQALRAELAARQQRRARLAAQLTAARTALTEQRIRDAHAIAAELKTADPDAAGVEDLWRQTSEALARLEERERRARAISEQLDAAERLLEGGDAAAALERAQRGLDLDGTDVRAQQLAQAARQALEEQRRRREDERAQAVAREGRALAAASRFDEALHRLRAYTPPHPLIVEALAEVQTRADDHARREEAARRAREEAEQRQREAERRAREEAEQRRREEAERRERAITDHLAAAREFVERGALQEALTRSDAALALDAKREESLQLAGRVRMLIADRRRAEEQRAAQEAARALEEQRAAERAERARQEQLAAERAERAREEQRQAAERAERQREEQRRAEREARERQARREEERRLAREAEAAAKAARKREKALAAQRAAEARAKEREAARAARQRVEPAASLPLAADTAVLDDVDRGAVPVPARARPRTDVLVAGGAALAIVAALVWYVTRPPAPAESEPPATPPSVATPAGPPPSVASPEAAPLTTKRATIESLLKQDEVRGLSALVAGLRETPADQSLNALLTDLLRSAKAEASQTRDQATAALRRFGAASRLNGPLLALRRLEQRERDGVSPELVESYWRVRDEIDVTYIDVLAGRDPRAAAGRLEESLSRHPSSSTLNAALSRLVEAARTDTERLRAAVARDKAAVAAPEYRQGITRAAQADPAARRPSDLSTYADARDLFRRAQASARLAASKPPVADPGPVTPPSPPVAMPTAPAEIKPPAPTATPAPSAAPPTGSPAPAPPATTNPPGTTNPPVSTPKPSPATVVSEEVLVEQTVRGYAQAFTAQNPEAAASFWPSVPVDQRRREFGANQTQTLSIGRVEVQVAGNTARARVDGLYTFEPRANVAPPRLTRFVFILQKVGGRWIITRLQAN